MKRTVAIVLSLILIGIQTMVAVQTTSAGLVSQTTAACCKTNCCCVSEATSAPQSLPAATTPLAAQNNFTAVLSMLVVWTLPESARSQFVSSASAPTLASALPIFTRDCALLI